MRIKEIYENQSAQMNSLRGELDQCFNSETHNLIRCYDNENTPYPDYADGETYWDSSEY